jgi:hypothetical protein
MSAIDYSAMKLGRLPARYDARTLRMSSYMPPKLPPPLGNIDHTMGLRNWGMMRNNEIGDCTAAAAAHAVQVWTINTSAIETVSDDQVVDFYRLFGYDPTRPETDQGAVELDVLNRWRRDGFCGHKIIAYVAADHSDQTQVRTGCQLFGGLYLGIVLPKSAQFQQTWDVAKDDLGIWGGHAVWMVGYDSHGVTVVTWGKDNALLGALLHDLQAVTT